MRKGRAWATSRLRAEAFPTASPGGSPQGHMPLCSQDKELCLLSSSPFSSMMCQLSVVESKSATFPSEKARHLLDDSVLESRSPRRGLTLTSSTAITNGLSLGKRLWPLHTGRGSRPSVCSMSVSVSLCCAQWPLTLEEWLPYRNLWLQGGIPGWPSPSGSPQMDSQVEEGSWT